MKIPLFVLNKIDEILAWEQRKETERDTKFVELGRYLCEVRAGQYWRLEDLKSFDEFLERRFPESRRKAYYLMSIHEHLPPQARKQLKEVGWTKGLVGQTGQEGRAAPRLCNLVAPGTGNAQRAVQAGSRKGTDGAGNGTVGKPNAGIERAIETACLMLGSDRSRGYCLEMTCADFPAGANLDHGDPEMLLFSMTRFVRFLPEEQRRAFLEGLSEKAP